MQMVSLVTRKYRACTSGESYEAVVAGEVTLCLTTTTSTGPTNDCI